jgi:hypothetical protein
MRRPICQNIVRVCEPKVKRFFFHIRVIRPSLNALAWRALQGSRSLKGYVVWAHVSNLLVALIRECVNAAVELICLVLQKRARPPLRPLSAKGL